LEKERLEKKLSEKERLEKERLEKERLEKEQLHIEKKIQKRNQEKKDDESVDLYAFNYRSTVDGKHCLLSVNRIPVGKISKKSSTNSNKNVALNTMMILQIQQQLEELTEMVKCLPGLGPDYQKVKTDFEKNKPE